MRALDLFSGAGGWKHPEIATIGLEENQNAVKTAQAAGGKAVCADVRTVSPPKGDWDGLIASPPCQTFSRAGKLAGYRDMSALQRAVELVFEGKKVEVAVHEADCEGDDARSHLILEPMRYLRAMNPAWVAMENVPLTLPIWETYADLLRSIGYSVWTGIMDAADYGVPQRRRRAILIGRKSGNAAMPPYGERRVIQDVLPCDPEWRLRTGAWADSATSNRREAAPSEVSPTLSFGKDSGGWQWRFPSGALEPVPLSDLGCLQGFPPDYPWQGGRMAVLSQIGNAIPPPLAEAVLNAAIRDPFDLL